MAKQVQTTEAQDLRVQDVAAAQDMALAEYETRALAAGEIGAGDIYSEAIPTVTGKAQKALPQNVQTVFEAGNTFAKVLAKAAQGAHPDTKKPFAVYTRRDNGSPRLPDRQSAEAVMHFTAKCYRKNGGPSIRLKIVQLPGSDYAVFAFKSGTKRRFALGSEPITC